MIPVGFHNGRADVYDMNFDRQAGNHSHTWDFPNHTHTLALGGSGADIDVTPKHIVANHFIYLG
jgi:hypothetical protein